MIEIRIKKDEYGGYEVNFSGDEVNKISDTALRKLADAAVDVYFKAIDESNNVDACADMPFCEKCEFFREDKAEGEHAPCEFYGIMTKRDETCMNFEKKEGV